MSLIFKTLNFTLSSFLLTCTGKELVVEVPEDVDTGAVVAGAGGSNFDSSPADPMLVIICFQIPNIIFQLCKFYTNYFLSYVLRTPRTQLADAETTV